MELEDKELGALGAALRRAQNPRLERLDVSATKARLLAGSRSRRTRAPLAFAFAALAIGAALIAFWPRALAVSVDGQPVAAGAWIAASDTAVVVGFSEGSRFELAPGSQARLTEIDERGARLTVERGEVRAAVTPGRDGRWQIELGPYAVVVTGTRFVAAWQPEDEALSVALHEGRVRVEGPQRMAITMAPGQILEVARRGEVSLREGNAIAPTPTAIATVTVEGSSSPPIKPPAPAQATPSAAAPVASAPTWRALASEERYAEALAAAQAAGVTRQLELLDAASLALLADVARFAGDGATAREALLALRRRASGETAARAAFLLGRLAFAGDPGAAAGWFARYLAEAPAGPLAREAEGRLIEAHLATGDGDAAARVAEAYLSRHPDGPHAALARRAQAEAADPYR